jgi:hypothetical protein
LRVRARPLADAQHRLRAVALQAHLQPLDHARADGPAQLLMLGAVGLLFSAQVVGGQQPAVEEVGVADAAAQHRVEKF